MKKSWCFIFLVLLVIGSFAAVARGPLEDIATTFGDLNLAGAYERSPQFFDFVIFAIIFITISVYSLGKAFPEKTGKILGAVIGIALTIAFMTWEYTSKFTIQNLGPIAATVVMIVLGLIVYWFVSLTQIGGVYSVLLAIVVTFFTIEAIVPDVFDWISTNGGAFLLAYSFIKVGVWISVIILLWKGIASLARVIKGAPGVEEGAEAVKKGVERLKEKREKKEVEKDIEKDIEKRLGRSLRRVYRYGKKVSDDLKKAHKESLKGKEADADKLKKYLEEAGKFEKEEVDFDALANELVTELEAISKAEPKLKEELKVLNDLLRKNLSKIREQVEKAEKAKNISTVPAILVSALDASKKIQNEILGMEAVVKGMKKEL